MVEGKGKEKEEGWKRRGHEDKDGEVKRRKKKMGREGWLRLCLTSVGSRDGKYLPRDVYMWAIYFSSFPPHNENLSSPAQYLEKRSLPLNLTPPQGGE